MTRVGQRLIIAKKTRY